MASSTSTTPAVIDGGATTINALPPDVFHTHILTRLDGPTLASASCVSSQLQSLTTRESLWEDICRETWPSIDNPRVHQLISTFPNGPRSFFSDSFPHLLSRPGPTTSQLLHPSSPSPPELIFAVDIHYRDNLIFSKVQETETLTGWFQHSPFRIDLLDPKDMVPTPIKARGETCRDLAEDLTLSWIVIDPTGRRAANLSSCRPISVEQHWLSGIIQARFATVLAGDLVSTEFVQWEIVVTFGGCEGGEMQVREIFLQVEDMEGRNLNGKDSLVILQRAMGDRRRMRGRREEGKERYEEYLELKRDRKERKLRREARLDTMCITFGVSIFYAALWMLFTYLISRRFLL